MWKSDRNIFLKSGFKIILLKKCYIFFKKKNCIWKYNFRIIIIIIKIIKYPIKNKNIYEYFQNSSFRIYILLLNMFLIFYTKIVFLENFQKYNLKLFWNSRRLIYLTQVSSYVLFIKWEIFEIWKKYFF